MARNRYAGSHPSYKKRGMSKEQIAKKRAYDKKYHQYYFITNKYLMIIFSSEIKIFN